MSSCNKREKKETHYHDFDALFSELVVIWVGCIFTTYLLLYLKQGNALRYGDIVLRIMAALIWDIMNIKEKLLANFTDFLLKHENLKFRLLLCGGNFG